MLIGITKTGQDKQCLTLENEGSKLQIDGNRMKLTFPRAYTLNAAGNWVGQDETIQQITLTLEREDVRRIVRVHQRVVKQNAQELVLVIGNGASPRVVDLRMNSFEQYWDLTREEAEQILVQLDSPFELWKRVHSAPSTQRKLGEVVQFVLSH